MFILTGVWVTLGRNGTETFLRARQEYFAKMSLHDYMEKMFTH